MTPQLAIAEPTVPVAVTMPDETLCNCYTYVKERIPELPNTSELKGNTVPEKGAVVLFEYVGEDGEAVKHYAILRTFEGDGFWVDENNYKKCVTSPRYVYFNDKSIKGFWKSPTSPPAD